MWATLDAVDADAAAAAVSVPAVNPNAINSPNPRRRFILLPPGRPGARRCAPEATALAEQKHPPGTHRLSRVTTSDFCTQSFEGPERCAARLAAPAPGLWHAGREARRCVAARLSAEELVDVQLPRLARRQLVRCGDELQDAGRGQVLLVNPHAERRERVLDCVHQRRRRDDHATLADAAEVDVGVEGHGLEVRYLDTGNIARGRQQVIHERGGLAVAVLVVRRP